MQPSPKSGLTPKRIPQSQRGPERPLFRGKADTNARRVCLFTLARAREKADGAADIIIVPAPLKPLTRILKVGSLEPGDYVAMPRLDGKYVGARIYKGAAGIFSGIHAAPQDLGRLKGKSPGKFYYYCSLPGGRYQKDWIFLGRVPFTDPEELWPPAMSTTDGIYKTKPQVYWKERFMDVTEEELKGKQQWVIHGFKALQEIVSGTYQDPWRRLRRNSISSR